MFGRDDFINIVVMGFVSIFAYNSGKKQGVQETIAEYDAKAVIKAQQQQIDALNAKLNSLKSGNL